MAPAKKRRRILKKASDMEAANGFWGNPEAEILQNHIDRGDIEDVGFLQTYVSLLRQGEVMRLSALHGNEDMDDESGEESDDVCVD
eukprot:347560-Chlamydomonas_euryale.AAC.1